MILAATATSNRQQATGNSNSNKQQATAGGPKLDISGTPMAQGPKLRPKDPLPKPHLSTKFQVKTHQGAGSVGKKVLKIWKIWKS